MILNELYDDFIKLFPEDSDFFRECEKTTGADVNDGMHVVFGMVVVPFLRKVVKESPDKATRAFSFIEKMETSGDTKIAELVEFTVLEDLLTEDAELASEYAKYFGPETKAAAKAVSRWFKS